MARKCRWYLGGLALLLAGAGCCRMCDRWCGEKHCAPAACCTPCAPCAAAAPAAAAPAPQQPTWQRNYSSANGCCP